MSRFRGRDDESLAARAARGDERAFALLHERHAPALLRTCLAVCGNPDDARDALQDGLLRASQALRRDGAPRVIAPWLHKIVRNAAIDVLRGRRGVTELPETLPAPTAGPADRAIVREELAALVGDLNALTERQRTALLLREFEGMGYGDIAVALEVSPGVAKQRVHEGRAALFEFAAGRELPCSRVRDELMDGDGRGAHSRRLRAHLRGCPSCSAVARRARDRRRALAALFPAAPLAVGLAGSLGGAFRLNSRVVKTTAVGAAATVAVTAAAVALTSSGGGQRADAATDSAAAASTAPVHRSHKSAAKHRHHTTTAARGHHRSKSGGNRTAARSTSAVATTPSAGLTTAATPASPTSAGTFGDSRAAPARRPAAVRPNSSQTGARTPATSPATTQTPTAAPTTATEPATSTAPAAGRSCAEGATPLIRVASAPGVEAVQNGLVCSASTLLPALRVPTQLPTIVNLP